MHTNQPPLLEPRPEPLHVVAVSLDPLRTGHWGFVLFGRDRRTGATLPDVLAEGVTAEPPVSHHPLGHPWQALQERDGLREFMSLPGSENEGHRPSQPIGDHASFGSIAPTRAAQRLTLVPLRLRSPFRAAPAAF